jgi:hypothetical protein
MKPSEAEFLTTIAGLPAIDRAAAIAHRVYVSTAQRQGWDIRVATDWSALDPAAREFNVEAARTWVQDQGLLTAWLHAVLEARLQAPPL